MKKIIYDFFILATLLNISFVTQAQTSCIEDSLTTEAMSTCPNIGFKEADAELNRVYNLIKKLYQDDLLFLEKLKVSQRAWIKLRDADFDLQYPYQNESRYYGSVFPTCADEFKTQLTIQRVAFLKRWLVGSEEGDVCSGSVMNERNIQ